MKKKETTTNLRSPKKTPLTTARKSRVVKPIVSEELEKEEKITIAKTPKIPGLRTKVRRFFHEG
jgi:hypothetical protein